MLPVKVKCKKCNKEAKSDEFTLDPVYKMMVCRECVKERKMGEMIAHKAKAQGEKAARDAQEAKKRPAGWDFEDVEVERAYAAKQSKSKPVPIDAETVRYTCSKCKYQFVVNVIDKRPARCGYCGTAVQL